MPPGNSISDPIFNTLICLLLSLTLFFYKKYFSFLLWEAFQKKEATLIQLFLCFNGFFIHFFFRRPNKLLFIKMYPQKHRNFYSKSLGLFCCFCCHVCFFFFFNSADAFNIILGWFHNSINFSTLPYFFVRLKFKKLCVVFSVFWFRRNVYDSGFNW